MKIVTKDAVYLQKEDIACFNEVVDKYFDRRDIPKFMRLFRHQIFTLNEENQFDFLEFRKQEEIEYIKEIYWIVDYKNIKDMSIQELTEICQNVLEERYRIANEYNAMSEEEREYNIDMSLQCACYDHEINTLANMVYFKQGDISINLPKGISYPKEVKKINPANIKRMIKSIVKK